MDNHCALVLPWVRVTAHIRRIRNVTRVDGPSVAIHPNIYRYVHSGKGGEVGSWWNIVQLSVVWSLYIILDLVLWPNRHSHDGLLYRTQCPTKQPMCDIVQPGSSYCTFTPDTTCYAKGWPPCCFQNAGVNCPKVKPPCRIDSIPPLGSSYCTYAPDTKCYKSGWPQCCDESNNLHVGEKAWTVFSTFCSSSWCPHWMYVFPKPLAFHLMILNKLHYSVPLCNPRAIKEHQDIVTARSLQTLLATPTAGLRAVLKMVGWIVRKIDHPVEWTHC